MLNKIYEKYVLKHFKIMIIIGGIVIAASAGFILIYHNSFSKQKNDDNEVKDIVKRDIVEEPVVPQKGNYYVDIKGAVVNPNVYSVVEGARVIDVIRLAGGLTKQADTSVLNLSKKVSDEMTIIIYTDDDMVKFKKQLKPQEEIIKYIEKECKCPDPDINDACTDTEENNDDGDSTKVSLNNATKDELMTLSGIGEAKAQDIIDYRVSNGGFKTIDDIKNVTGIGDSIFAQIKDYITL